VRRRGFPAPRDQAELEMATVVSVMDRASFKANTDNIVVVHPGERTLTWVPRDLWCEGIGDRINRSFALAGHGGIIAALAEHRIEVRHSICLSREAVERGLEGVTVAMPVSERLEFWYPVNPTRNIEDGRKRVVFESPVERLSGERIHQWLGARYRVGAAGSDLHRIGRQQELVAVMLGSGSDFRRFLDPPKAVRISDPGAIGEVSRVVPGWRFETVGGLVAAKLDGKDVLVPEPRIDADPGAAV
jgi:hypothetical protein